MTGTNGRAGRSETPTGGEAEGSVPDIRVAVVDDHRIVLDGLVVLLDSMDGLTVVGEATSGEQAIELVGRLRPDVVLMDIEMPGIGGVEATR